MMISSLISLKAVSPVGARKQAGKTRIVKIESRTTLDSKP